MVNITPGSPVALGGIEEMPPIGGLLAGMVCLSPAPVGPLRDAAAAHVVGSMEYEGLGV